MGAFGAIAGAGVKSANQVDFKTKGEMYNFGVSVIEFLYEPVMIDYSKKGIDVQTFKGEWVNLGISYLQKLSVQVTKQIANESEKTYMFSNKFGFAAGIGTPKDFPVAMNVAVNGDVTTQYTEREKTAVTNSEQISNALGCDKDFPNAWQWQLTCSSDRYEKKPVLILTEKFRCTASAA